MNFVRRIVGGVQPSYLVRAYLIGIVFFALTAGLTFKAGTRNGIPLGFVAFAALNTLLFPFAKLVWDELRNLVFGNNVIFVNALLLFAFKWIVNGLLWALAIFVAPVGILYLWFRTRHPKALGEDQAR